MEPIKEKDGKLGITQRNVIGQKVQELRLHSRGTVINQSDLAGDVIDAIMDVAPATAPVRKRRRFHRTDIVKIESGSRAVRDYELLALAKVFNVSVLELLGLPADGMVREYTAPTTGGGEPA